MSYEIHEYKQVFLTFIWRSFLSHHKQQMAVITERPKLRTAYVILFQNFKKLIDILIIWVDSKKRVPSRLFIPLDQLQLPKMGRSL